MNEAQEKKILAAVISYNRCDQLKETLEAILSQEGSSCDVIVVDNASTDGTQEMVTEYYAPRGVELCRLSRNTGCAGGINCAAKEGVVRGYDRVWIMDDDVVPEPNALLELLRADHVLNGKWGFMSSAAYWKDGSLCKANIQKKGVFSFVRKDDYDAGPVRIMMASICSLFLNTDVVKEVGLPIAEYFFYTEDYEFTSRIARNHPCYLVPMSKVRHNMAINAKASIVDDTPDRMWRYQYLYRNDVHCYKKLGVSGLAYLLAKTGYTTMKILAKSKGERKEKISLLYRGLIKGCTFDPAIEYVETYRD